MSRPTRASQFLAAASSAGELLAEPGLDDRWQAESALAGFTVGELAGHFVRAVGVTSAVVSRGPATGTPLEVVAYYTDRTASWTGKAGQIQRNAAEEAHRGPDGLRQRWIAALEESRQLLTGVLPPAVRTGSDDVLALDDYLLTRSVELLVHTDDLAASLDVPCPPAPPDLLHVVNVLLVDVATARHGERAVLRALTRRERDGAEALRVI